MQDNFIDLTITSPPYNVDLGGKNQKKEKYDSYNDNLTMSEYLLFLEKVFSSIYEKTKDGGRIAINIGDSKNGKIATHVYIHNIMTNIGWLPYSTIIWNKSHTNSRTAWGSWKSPSCPTFPSVHEYIMIFCKNSYKILEKGLIDVSREEFIEYSLGMWNITGSRNKEHPATFPEEIPKRLMKMLSYENALVYDPFMGSGTTAIACIRNNRRYLGSEISKNYIDSANNAIKGI